MRKFVGSFVFTGFAFATPLVAAPAVGDTVANNSEAPAVAVQQVRVPVPYLRDEAAMVLVGTALIGLAAAVRRAA